MSRVKIIAELAWGHDGSVVNAIELLKKSKNAGADIFSIHITSLPDYMVTYYGSGEGKVSSGREALDVYKYLEKINLSNEDWLLFAKEARSIGMPLCIMPNDMPSLEFAESRIDPDYYVVSAACFVEEAFLVKLAQKKKKTFFRIGGAYLGEIENAVNIFKREGNENIVLLHGFQNYPTKLEETNLSFLTTLRSTFNLEVGLADHIDGGDDIAMVIPAVAIPFGATYIEKHITLDRKLKSEDFESALDPDDFGRMVRYIRATEIATGQMAVSELSPATLRYRNISRKRIVAAADIPQGKIICISDLTFKRCDVGLTPDYLNSIINRKPLETIKKDDAITFENLL